MTRVVVDRDRCVGAGMCALTDPAVFDQSDDDGRVVLLEATPSSEHESSVRDAVHVCPSGAIRSVET
ncbi:ferredoxin [Actinomycetes bacterium KLBMP 9759]